ncbi:hypothetical protein HETIRDRAFT_459706 [Heterobasidion irregulare TC 32-1]|uniref:Uncharacterized protein n=1 Tax=Heterobasidion irregulare (strain TC 32-1) TaxID=747525 RepID=W4K343_HETIT|nr:uncharacterized protein HETIRDRAFT_459706 [Heterobasidion irregulare TC 32-1]ETW79760.1 hypothetical protein HETIRDRAFT_459706 [Heterobasidion irregulare TC 32-1]
MRIRAARVLIVGSSTAHVDMPPLPPNNTRPTLLDSRSLLETHGADHGAAMASDSLWIGDSARYGVAPPRVRGKDGTRSPEAPVCPHAPPLHDPHLLSSLQQPPASSLPSRVPRPSPLQEPLDTPITAVPEIRTKNMSAHPPDHSPHGHTPTYTHSKLVEHAASDQHREAHVMGLRLVLGSILSPKRPPLPHSSSGTSSPSSFSHASTHVHAHVHPALAPASAHGGVDTPLPPPPPPHPSPLHTHLPTHPHTPSRLSLSTTRACAGRPRGSRSRACLALAYAHALTHTRPCRSARPPSRRTPRPRARLRLRPPRGPRPHPRCTHTRRAPQAPRTRCPRRRTGTGTGTTRTRMCIPTRTSTHTRPLCTPPRLSPRSLPRRPTRRCPCAKA